jgi:putative flippase GtrA
VDWVDDPDSRVDVVATALADLKGVARLSRGLATGALPVAELRVQLGRAPLEPSLPNVPTGLLKQLARFGAIGVLSTLAYVALYLVLSGPLGPQMANLLALLVTAVANTSASRRLTFGVSGPGASRAQLQGLLVFGLGLALTSGSLAALNAISSSPGRPLEVAVLVTANVAATGLRFLLLRGWVFAAHRHTTPAASALPHAEPADAAPKDTVSVDNARAGPAARYDRGPCAQPPVPQPLLRNPS